MTSLTFIGIPHARHALDLPGRRPRHLPAVRPTRAHRRGGGGRRRGDRRSLRPAGQGPPARRGRPGRRRVAAVEMTFSATIGDVDVRHLRWLQDRLGPELLDAVVVSTGPYAYRRRDGIAVVPASLLGP